jgi:hypothetical protein
MRTISTNETEISQAIAATDKQIVEIGNRLQELSITDPAQEGHEVGKDRAEALEKVGQERAALDASQKVLEGATIKDAGSAPE